MSVVLEYSVGDTIITIAIFSMVLSSVGECGKPYSGVVGHLQGRALCSGQQAAVLGWDVDGGLFQSITGLIVLTPAGGSVHSLIPPVPVIASVRTVGGGGRRGEKHSREKHSHETVDETSSEGYDGDRDDLVTEV